MPETRAEAEAAGEAKYWQTELRLADKEEREWRTEEAPAIRELYTKEKHSSKRSSRSKFNILWANTETLRPALLPATPKGEIRRRHLTDDPIARDVAELLERALSFTNDDPQYDLDDALLGGVQDMLLPGRGVVRVKYDDERVSRETIEPQLDEVGQQVIDDNGNPVFTTRTVEDIVEQTTWCELVNWEDYRQSPAKQWKDVRWVAFREIMTKDEVAEEFSPELADAIPYNHTIDPGEKKTEEQFKRAEVWEIWDKVGRVRLYVVKGFDKLLDKTPDPLKLQTFFPCPAPLMAVHDTDSMCPIPEFRLWADQAEELDKITGRIAALINAIRRRGVFDASQEETLKKLRHGGDNDYFPVENWAQLIEKGGLAGVFASEDIAPAVAALRELYIERQQLLDTIFQLTGISDLIRGQADPREKATTSRIKERFGSMRLRSRQAEVQRFVRDLYRLKAEIIAELYTPAILERLTGMPIDPDKIQQEAQTQAQQLQQQGIAQPQAAQQIAQQLQQLTQQTAQAVDKARQMLRVMRSDKLRSYNIDVETDTTALEDSTDEKEQRIEFVRSLTEFIGAWQPMVSGAPALMPLVGQLLLFAMKPFKVGRPLEETVEQTMSNLAQQLSQPQPSEEDAEAEIERQRLETETQLEHQKIQAMTQVKQAEIAARSAVKREEIATDDATARLKIVTDAQTDRARNAFR